MKKKDAKKRERDSLFPSSSTFYGLVKSHVSDRSVSLSMDPHSRKKPLPFPPPNKKKKTKKNTKNWTVLVKHHQDENVRWKRRLKTKKKHFFVVFIYRKKKRKTTLTDETRPIPISLSNNITNLLSKRQKNARDDIVLSSRKRKRKRHQTKCCYARKR